MRTFPTLPPLVAVALLLTACGGTDAREPAEPARVWIISPTEGQVVTGPDVMVELGASGVRITPAAVHDAGTGHHHLFVNRDLTPLDDTIPAGVTGIIHLGQGQTEFLLEGMEPGEHQVIAVLAEWSHVPVVPTAIDTVRFTVVAPDDPGQP